MEYLTLKKIKRKRSLRTKILYQKKAQFILISKIQKIFIESAFWNTVIRFKNLPFCSFSMEKSSDLSNLISSLLPENQKMWKSFLVNFLLIFWGESEPKMCTLVISLNQTVQYTNLLPTVNPLINAWGAYFIFQIWRGGVY